MALDSHDTNGRNQSHTVCGTECALSITLALTLAFWDCGGHVWDFILPRTAVAWVVGEEEDLQGTWPPGRGFGRLGRITSPSSLLGQTC